MTEKEMWKQFKNEYNIENDDYQSWEFGFDADLLADLVRKGHKRATTSLYLFYQIDNEPLPKEGAYGVILNSKGEAICIIQITRVFITPFNHVTEEYAYREGEGDKTLLYWKKVHKTFFENELSELGIKFEEKMNVVCEEFEVVYCA